MISIQVAQDIHNPVKEHVFITLEDGGVWYNQGINGKFFYNYFVPANDTGYTGQFEGELKRPERMAPVLITSEEAGNHSASSEYRSYINQKLRTVYVEKINSTRARAEYELPRAGWTGTWIPVAKYKGAAITQRVVKPGKSPVNKYGVAYS